MQPNDYDKEVIPVPDSAVVLDEDDPCPTTGGKKKRKLETISPEMPAPDSPILLEEQDDQTSKRIKLQDANSRLRKMLSGFLG